MGLFAGLQSGMRATKFSAQGGARTEQAVGRQKGRGPNDFSDIFLQITVLIVFVQFFGQISNSFFCSNYSNGKFDLRIQKLHKHFCKV
jgi:hypothetical protein